MRTLFCLVLAVLAHAAGARDQSSTGTCVVILDEATGAITPTDADACRTRLSPASSFKIPHALVALETGVVTRDGIERWDGTRYPGQPSWEADHTVASAMKPSVLWFFQRIAPRIGAERMRGWLRRFDYGNADTSGPIASYWINGRLLISPEEQLRFLRRFYGHDLPVSADHLDLVQGALLQRPGTVENARGVQRLAAEWRDGITLNAKTGATTTAAGSVSWLVGRLAVDQRGYVFAAASWGPSGTVDNLAGATAAIRTFVSRGVLRPPP